MTVADLHGWLAGLGVTTIVMTGVDYWLCAFGVLFILVLISIVYVETH